MTTRAGWPTWRPPNETLEAIAEVIAAHWHAAKACPERRFWPSAESWLRSAYHYHFTSGGKLIK
jgi:hypothetical protein